MSVEIKVPTLGESVTEATIARWFKKAGEAVSADEPLVELETDKVTLEVNSPASGRLAEVLAAEGSDVEVGAVLGRIEEGAAGARPAGGALLPARRKPRRKSCPGRGQRPPQAGVAGGRVTAPRARVRLEGRHPRPARRPPRSRPRRTRRRRARQAGAAARSHAGPRRRARSRPRRASNLAQVQPTGPKGNVTKGDVLAAEAKPAAAPAPARRLAPAPAAPAPRAAATVARSGSR
jgi:2-oxoglutarate dehydrogenase E2 component (dihydrolipoamide succinyltransferase)